MAGAPNRKIIKPQLLEFLSKAPGSTHYVSDLANGFAVSEQQIRNTIGDIIRTNALPGLEVTIATRAWTYRPGPAGKTSKGSERRVFEELAVTRGGDIVIQDQNGNLYRAKELE